MFIHLLSKGTRRKLVKLVVRKAGTAEAAASILGVSRTAVYKFLNGMTPSDKTIENALWYLRSSGGYEWSEAVSTITRELRGALIDFAEYAGLQASCNIYSSLLEVVAR